MKKGFTLIELMIVIIIIGVLATIGIVQYQAAVEKSRGAEARSVIGYLRSQCAAVWMSTNDTTDCSNASLGLGTSIPGATCNGTNWFRYGATGTGASKIYTATRCTSGGKNPNATGTAGTVVLTANYGTGTDAWTTTGGF